VGGHILSCSRLFSPKLCSCLMSSRCLSHPDAHRRVNFSSKMAFFFSEFFNRAFGRVIVSREDLWCGIRPFRKEKSPSPPPEELKRILRRRPQRDHRLMKGPPFTRFEGAINPFSEVGSFSGLLGNYDESVTQLLKRTYQLPNASRLPLWRHTSSFRWNLDRIPPSLFPLRIVNRIPSPPPIVT